MTSKASSYETLLSVDVSKDTKKKGKFNYLSWAHALHLLQREYPDATWETKRFDGLPYLKTELGFFVEVSVTIECRELSQLHPVLDNRNQPIAKPTSFQINTSIQRCLAKAIALHGLGLCVFAGEDLVYLDALEPEAISGVGEIKELAYKCEITERVLLEKMQSREPEIKFIAHASTELKQAVIKWLKETLQQKEQVND